MRLYAALLWSPMVIVASCRRRCYREPETNLKYFDFSKQKLTTHNLESYKLILSDGLLITYKIGFSKMPLDVTGGLIQINAFYSDGKKKECKFC